MNATLYTYHGIQYTYADLQRAYIRRLDATEKAIDAEQYAKASEIIRTDVREYLPQIADRQQTGDKNALTPRRKCGIIKAIRRHVRRWKRKQEVKKMKRYNFEDIYADVCGWTQTAEELASWTVPQMLEELKGMEKSGDLKENEAVDGITLEEAAKAYTEAAHRLAADLMK